MSNPLSKYGWMGLDWQFGENNELRDKFYVADATKAEDVLKLLFGAGEGDTGGDYQPLQHPRFKSFYAMECNVLPVHDKGVQANDDGQGNWEDSIIQPSSIKGGLVFHITYRPMITSGYYTHVTEQAMDYSAQIMSVISNAPAQQQDKCLKWSDGSPCTNLRGIMKVVPKVDFMQKRIFLSKVPTSLQQSFIGSVNNSPFTMLDESIDGSQIVWPTGTVLLSAMPTVRRFRFDGQPIWDVTMKFSAITLKDKIEDESIDNVTWQRLYHVDKSYWDTVTWADGSPLYPTNNLNSLV